MILPLILLLSAPLALASADPDADGDVIAEISIVAPSSAIHDYLMDLGNYVDLSPDDCIQKWQLGERSEGVGASAKLRYVAPPIWRRGLTMVLIEENERRITLDHPGNKGFVTTLDMKETGEGITSVTMHTWVNAPPKPFQGAYFKWVQPHWRDCQERFLTNLAAEVTP
jgi:hypothetical protein